MTLLQTAVSHAFRAKTRTLLTILSIVIGAFTLSITSGLGTGVNDYIDSTVSGVGGSNTMTVTKAEKDSGGTGPTEYDPRAVAVSRGRPGSTVSALTSQDLDTIRGIGGVISASGQRAITPEYVQQGDGTKYVATVASLAPGQTATLDNGKQPDDASADNQVALPSSYIAPLGFSSAADAVGRKVTLAIADGVQGQHTIQATVVGVTEAALASSTGSSVLVNNAMSDALYAAQSTGVPPEQADQYSQATITFAAGSTDTQVDALKGRLEKVGYTAQTTEDQLGTITSVIDGIVLVLDAFGVIALLAAAFGIVNTLFMAVQERTREIGLMKAMGMGGGRIFVLFSLEAVVIGLAGSALGALAAFGVGTAASSALAGSLLSDLPGLTLIAFDPVSIAVIILLVMAIALIAGAMPAIRAARADPVESLRYE